MHFVYILRCADGTFYTGCTRHADAVVSERSGDPKKGKSRKPGLPDETSLRVVNQHFVNYVYHAIGGRHIGGSNMCPGNGYFSLLYMHFQLASSYRCQLAAVFQISRHQFATHHMSRQ